MNQQRRKEIQDALDQLLELKERIDFLRDEEREAFDNLPEGLQAAQKGQESEAAADALDTAFDAIEEAETALQEAIQ